LFNIFPHLQNILARNSKSTLYLIGRAVSTSLNYVHLGNSIKSLVELYEGRHFVCKELVRHSKILILISPSIAFRDDVSLILSLIDKFAKKINASVNFLYLTSGDYVALELGYQSIYSYASQNTYELGYFIEVEKLNLELLEKFKFLVYQGSYLTEIAQSADILLPNPSFFEKKTTFLSCTGVLSTANGLANNFVREGWNIIKILSDLTGKSIKFASRAQVLDRFKELCPFNSGQLLLDSKNLFYSPKHPVGFLRHHPLA